MSPKSAYALLRRAGEGSDFAAAWDAAIDQGRANALDTGIERALGGTIKPIFYRGRQIGEQRLYNDGLLIAALRALNPRGRTERSVDPEWGV